MTTSFYHEGVRVPVKIKRERRRSIRYSITRKSINLLIPTFLSGEEIKKEVEKLQVWGKEEFSKNPSLLNRFRVIVYKNGEFIRVFGKDFKILIFEEKRKGLTGRITSNKYVELRVPQDAEESLLHDAIGKLLSRIFSGYFHEDIVKRVQHFNQKYFQEKIVHIRLKNNQSNWGSCSSKRNINLSSRLLFAPLEVLDYVIVHELAHLKEMNHSPRFWKIVHDIMPNYKEKEDWLDKHGHTLKY